MLLERSAKLAGLRIEREADTVSFAKPRDWLRAGELGLALFLALAAFAAAERPDRHLALLLIATLLLCLWIPATAEWRPILSLRRKLTIRWPAGSYRAASQPCELVADDRLLDVRSVQFICITVAMILGRYAPSYAVYIVGSRAIVHVTETREADQAVALARLIRADLTPDTSIFKTKGAPSPGWGPVCLALIASTIALFAIYSAGVALVLKKQYSVVEFVPERAAWVVPAMAALLAAIAFAGRLAVERCLRREIRTSIRELFGVERSSAEALTPGLSITPGESGGRLSFITTTSRMGFPYGIR